MRCWTVLLVVAACRYDFDPVPDATAASGGFAGTAESHVVCQGTDCVVDCRAWASCEVDCGAALACVVFCPDTGCVVTSCTMGECSVQCGDDFHGATYLATTATCP